MVDYLDGLADRCEGTHREHVEEAIRELEWFSQPAGASIQRMLREEEGRFGDR